MAHSPAQSVRITDCQDDGEMGCLIRPESGGFGGTVWQTGFAKPGVSEVL